MSATRNSLGQKGHAASPITKNIGIDGWVQIGTSGNIVKG